MKFTVTGVSFPLRVIINNPVSTGLGEVFHYVVTAKGYDFSTLSEEERIKKLTELRTLHDWSIKPKLRTVKLALAQKLPRRK